MKGSWRITSIAGIGIDVHWSFSFIILWVIIQSGVDNRALANTIFVLGGVLLVFGCIILHEIGHALMALSLNLEVKNIVLLPFGGLTHIESVPDKPGHELLIAMAGPLVNLALVLMLTPLLMASIEPGLLNALAASPVTAVDTIIVSFFRENTLIGLIMLLLVANLILFAFNLIPAFPMDGGRILRAVLTLFFPYWRATRIAVGVGMLIAILLMVVGYRQGSVGLLFIAVFIFLGARPARV